MTAKQRAAEAARARLAAAGVHGYIPIFLPRDLINEHMIWSGR